MTPSATEDVKKVEIPYMAGETVKCLDTLKNSKAVSQKVIEIPTKDPKILLLAI